MVYLNTVKQTLGETTNVTNEAQAAGQNFFDKFIAGLTSRYGALKEAASYGVEQAQAAAREKAKEEIITKWNANDEQIKKNNAEIYSYQSALTAKGDSASGLTDASAQEAALQQLGVSAEQARSKIDELKAANQELEGTNKQLENSLNEVTNAENGTSAAHELHTNKLKEGSKGILNYASTTHQLASATSAVASGLNMVATMIGNTTAQTRTASGLMMVFSGVLRSMGAIWQWVTLKANEATAAQAGAFPWMAAIMGAINLISGLITMIPTAEKEFEDATKRAEELTNKAKELKANYRTLDTSIKKYKELEQARYDSAESAKEYQDAVDKIAESYPALIDSYTATGEAILNASAMEEALATARDESAAATLRAAQAEADKARAEKKKLADDLHKSNDTFDDFALTDLWAGSKTTTRSLYKMTFEEYNSFQNSEADRAILAKVQEMDRAVEALDTDGIIRANKELNALARQYDIVFSDEFVRERNKVLDATSQYRAIDQTIVAADKATVSAFINDRYGASDSTSIFKDNTALANLAANALYNYMVTNEQSIQDSSLADASDELFKDINDAWNTIPEAKLKEINTILEHPEAYSADDFKAAVNNYSDLAQDWILSSFDAKVEENEAYFKKIS